MHPDLMKFSNRLYVSVVIDSTGIKEEDDVFPKTNCILHEHDKKNDYYFLSEKFTNM